MTIEQLLTFNVALIAAFLSPGPAMLIAIRATLRAGRPAGITVGAGLATMSALWTLAALLGLDAVFNIFPWAAGLTRLVGAAYLLFIAYRTWIGAREPVTENGRAHSRVFRDGFIVNMLNPKAVFFSAAVLVVIFPSGLSAASMALIVGNHFILEFGLYFALASIMSTAAVGRRYLGAKLYIDRVAAMLLGALGIRLLVSR